MAETQPSVQSTNGGQSSRPRPEVVAQRAAQRWSELLERVTTSGVIHITSERDASALFKPDAGNECKLAIDWRSQRLVAARALDSNRAPIVNVELRLREDGYGIISYRRHACIGESDVVENTYWFLLPKDDQRVVAVNASVDGPDCPESTR